MEKGEVFGWRGWAIITSPVCAQAPCRENNEVEQLVSMSRYVGELETQMLALGGAPRGNKNLLHDSETIGKTQRDVESQKNGQAA